MASELSVSKENLFEPLRATMECTLFVEISVVISTTILSSNLGWLFEGTTTDLGLFTMRYITTIGKPGFEL